VLKRSWRGLVLAASALLAACAAPCDFSQGDVLPISLAGGKPVVPVQINGTRVPFLLDTGATGTSLFAESATALRLPADRMRNTTARGVGGISQQRNALVQQMRVGEREMQRLTVPVLTHNRPTPLPMAGLIGADFLRASEVEIDFPARRFVLHDARTCFARTAPGWTGEYDTIPLEVLPSGLVRLRVEVNGSALWAVLDTGAEHSTMLRSVAADLGISEAALSGKPVGVVHGIGATRVELRVQRFDTIQIGAETLRNVPVGIIDIPAGTPFGMLLGLDYIAQRRLWLSYTQQRLYVQRVDVPPGPRKAPL
jgi:predicted aspartyl protease